MGGCCYSFDSYYSGSLGLHPIFHLENEKRRQTEKAN